MLTKSEAVQTRKYNYNQIRELVRLSYGLGVNLTAPTPFKESLRIICVILVVSSSLSLYGHWCEFIQNLRNIPKLAEAVCTAFQATISILKMIYYLFYQGDIAKLLDTALTHQILQQIDIFQHDFPVNKELREKIDITMKTIWRQTRLQLIFYATTCSSIMCLYFFPPLVLNSYHKIKQTPGYVPILPFTGFYEIWADKGMASPYYDIQMFLSSSGLYVAGLCAISFEIVFVTLCCHAVGLVKVLNLIIAHSTSAQVPPERRVEYLRYCIYYYERVNDFVMKVDRMYQHISLPQFLFSLFIYGLVLFEMNYGLESDVTILFRMVVYISASGTEIILYCANAQRLLSVSQDIPVAFYSCEWFDQSEEFKQLLRMMILRTNRPFHLHVSWFTTMNMATLISLFRMSGSYFLMLRNLQLK